MDSQSRRPRARRASVPRSRPRSSPSGRGIWRSARRPAAPVSSSSARGGVLRRNNLRRIRLRALDATGLDGVRFHDLRHTGNTLAAAGGATTRELMHRTGHSSVRAALVHQHLVNGRDPQIAD
ncbi:hypothetical protein, partial [Streptomyces sp. NPDC046978]|uniref:hypothetical protein n=1 Tax=Streptomyces sp. NPDC046978 TaxID=3154704 RepID=UPI0033F823B9